MHPSLGPRRIYQRTCPNDYRASPSMAGLPHCADLVSDSCSSGPSFAISFLQIPPHGGHPCLGWRFRSSRPAEDFHLQDAQHAWHTRISQLLFGFALCRFHLSFGLVKGGRAQGSSTAISHAAVVLEVKLGVLKGIRRRTADSLLELFDKGELELSAKEKDSIRMARGDT